MGFFKDLGDTVRNTVKEVQDKADHSKGSAGTADPEDTVSPWPLPSAYDVSQALEDTVGAHRMTDWDLWLDAGSAIGWEPVRRRFVIGDGYEALIFDGADGTSMQLGTKEVPEISRQPELFRRSLPDGVDRPPPFAGVGLFAVARDYEGYATAVVVINDLVFFVRFAGGDGTQADLARVERVASAALVALPE